MALLTQRQRCPAQVDESADGRRAVVWLVGFPPHHGRIHGAPTSFRLHEGVHVAMAFGYTKVKRKMVSLYYVWPATIWQYFTREHRSTGALNQVSD